MSKEIKIFIVESDRFTREGFKAVLNRFPEFDCVGDSYNISQSLKNSKLGKAAVVLLEIKAVKSGFIDGFRALRENYPEIRVIGHSTEIHKAAWIKLLVEEGMNGYFLKNTAIRELYFAIMQVIDGGGYFAPVFTKYLLNLAGIESMSSNYVSNLTLSTDEIAVLQFVSEGFTNREIAQRLSTSSRTIEARRRRLLKKTNTSNTATLIKYATRFNLIKEFDTGSPEP